jgi:putative lipoprotein
MRSLTTIEVLALAGLLLVGCARSPLAPPATELGVLRGTVSYSERIALPTDAVVEVTLSDISQQDVAAPVIGQTRLASEGRQIPLPFEIRYDQTRIEAKALYAVRATISSGGRMWFTTDTVHQVITQGHPTEVNLRLIEVGGTTQADP